VAAAKDEGEIREIDGREVTITRADKVYFSGSGNTKGDLVDHYLRVGEGVMRTMGGRPVLMQRFPDGAEGPSFFQKRVPKSKPAWLVTATVSTPNGTESEALVIEDLAHVAWAVNMGCLGFHVWPSRAANVEVADELRIDLDPGPGTDFEMAREAAFVLKELLDEHGTVAWPKTTGNRGIHVYVRLWPQWDSYDVRRSAVAIARELERRHPDLVTAAWWKEERGERIFIDFNQNAPHKTVFGAWSVRARPGAQVSTPLTWDDLRTVHPDDLDIAEVGRRWEANGDPWAAIDDELQSLDPYLAMFQKDRDDGLMDAPWPPVYPKQPDEPPRVAPSRAKKPD
jgi:DNA ligase D